MACRVLIVDDDDIFVELLRVVIERDEHLEFAGRARDGAEALAAFAELLPDVVTMDIDMPRTDGVAATRAIVAADPDARIVIVSGSIHQPQIDAARLAGASAYVSKHEAAGQLPAVLLAVCRGSRFLQVA